MRVRRLSVHETKPRLVEVALPLPLFQTFTYFVPDDLQNPVTVGSRVVVPFRNRREMGICVGTSTGAELKRKPKTMLESPDAEPAVGPSLLALCKRMAEHYLVTLRIT